MADKRPPRNNSAPDILGMYRSQKKGPWWRPPAKNRVSTPPGYPPGVNPDLIAPPQVIYPWDNIELTPPSKVNWGEMEFPLPPSFRAEDDPAGRTASLITNMTVA
jgi:hypothetical protein